MSNDKNKDTVVKMPLARVAFADIYEMNDKGKYSVTLIFEKGIDLSEFKQMCQKVVQTTWPDKAKRPKLKSPIKDANEPNQSGTIPATEWGFGDSFFLRTTSKFPPVFYDKKGNITERPDIYPGCYAFAAIQPFTYSKDGNSGVSTSAVAMQFQKDGERMAGGRPEVGHMFGGGAEDSGTGVDNPQNYQSESDDFI